MSYGLTLRDVIVSGLSRRLWKPLNVSLNCLSQTANTLLYEQGTREMDVDPLSSLSKEGSTQTRKLKHCRTGMYCPEGSIFHTNCPPGTYNPKTQSKSIDDCLPCDPGKYCAREELSAPSGNCAAGYYCAARSTSIAPQVGNESLSLWLGESSMSAQRNRWRTYQQLHHLMYAQELDSFGNGPCPAGSFCRAGATKPEACPKGTYQPSTHASESSQCIKCPAGWYGCLRCSASHLSHRERNLRIENQHESEHAAE